jgi:hypothetical protein
LKVYPSIIAPRLFVAATCRYLQLALLFGLQTQMGPVCQSIKRLCLSKFASKSANRLVFLYLRYTPCTSAKSPFIPTSCLGLNP